MISIDFAYFADQAHGSSDFRFECFAPDGFKHFRQGFGIDPSDFLISLCKVRLNRIYVTLTIGFEFIDVYLNKTAILVDL